MPCSRPCAPPWPGACLPRAPGTSESRLRFLHAVTAGTERLVMVRRVVDDDGRELAPSPYWVEACRVLGRNAEALDRRTGAHGELVDDLAAAPTRREALRRLAADRRTVPGELGDALARRSRARGVAPGTFDDLDSFRVTELESYLRCPYGWLSGAYLHPQPLEPPFDAAFEGTLGHMVVQRLYERMVAEGAGPCTRAALPRYAGALPEVLRLAFAESRPSGTGAEYGIFADRLRVHLEVLLEGEAEMGPAMTPTAFELTLADDGLLGLSPPGRLTGRVDRVDLSADGRALVVIDYKRTGAKLKRDGRSGGPPSAAALRPHGVARAARRADAVRRPLRRPPHRGPQRGDQRRGDLRRRAAQGPGDRRRGMAAHGRRGGGGGANGGGRDPRGAARGAARERVPSVVPVR